MKIASIFACTVALLCGAAFAAAPSKPATAPTPAPKWQKVKPQTPAGFTLSTHTIATYDGHDVVLTVYTPEKPGAYPAILDIHGGGWSQRQVEADKPMMERLASRGYTTAIIAYRLSTEAKYPAALNDCKSAVRYLRANAVKFKLDPDRIGVMGGSAGGHLSGLLAMTAGKPEFEGDGPCREQPSAVKAAIVMAATQDLVAANKEKTGEAQSSSSAELRPRSPTCTARLRRSRTCVPACRRRSSSKARRTR